MNIRQNFYELSPKWQYEFSDFNEIVIFTFLCYFRTIVYLADSNRLLAVGFFIVTFTWLLGNEHRLKLFRINLINKIEEIKNKDNDLAFEKSIVTKQKSVNFIIILAVTLIICSGGDKQLATDAAIALLVFAIRISLTEIAMNSTILKIFFGVLYISASFVSGSILIETYPEINIILLVASSIFVLAIVFLGFFYFVYGASLIYKFLSFQKIRIIKKMVSYIPT